VVSAERSFCVFVVEECCPPVIKLREETLRPSAK